MGPSTGRGTGGNHRGLVHGLSATVPTLAAGTIVCVIVWLRGVHAAANHPPSSVCAPLPVG